MDSSASYELAGFDDRNEFREIFYNDLVGCERFDLEVELVRRRLDALTGGERNGEAARLAEQFHETLDGIDARLGTLAREQSDQRILEEEHGLVLDLYVALKLGPLVVRFARDGLERGRDERDLADVARDGSDAA